MFAWYLQPTKKVEKIQKYLGYVIAENLAKPAEVDSKLFLC